MDIQNSVMLKGELQGMNKIVDLQEGKLRIEEYLKMYNLKDDVTNFSAFIFPVNSKLYDDVSIPSGHSPLNPKNLESNQELFNQFTSDVRSYFIENEFSITVVRDKKKEVKYEVLQNIDIILPILTFVGAQATALGINLLASYVWEKFRERKTSTIQADVVELKTDDMSYKRYKVSGSAEEVVEALRILSKEKVEKNEDDGK